MRELIDCCLVLLGCVVRLPSLVHHFSFEPAILVGERPQLVDEGGQLSISSWQSVEACSAGSLQLDLKVSNRILVLIVKGLHMRRAAGGDRLELCTRLLDRRLLGVFRGDLHHLVRVIERDLSGSTGWHRAHPNSTRHQVQVLALSLLAKSLFACKVLDSGLMVDLCL